MTETELIRVRDDLTQEVLRMRKSLKVSKVGTVAKAVTASILIVGGTAVACVFPNPMVLAALCGAAALLGGGNGVIKTARRNRKKKKAITSKKEELTLLNEEVSNEATIRRVMSGIGSGSFHEQVRPSAPTEGVGIYPPLIS